MSDETDKRRDALYARFIRNLSRAATEEEYSHILWGYEQDLYALMQETEAARKAAIDPEE